METAASSTAGAGNAGAGAGTGTQGAGNAAGPGGAGASQSATGGQGTGDIKVTDTASQQQASTWTEGFNDDLKNYVQTKGFQNPQAAVEAFRGLEKLRGVPQERLLKLPETAEDIAWNDVYSKLGKPDSPDGYGLQAGEGSDGAFANWAKDTFHKANLTTQQAHNIINAFSDYMNGKSVDKQEAYKTEVANQEIALKKDWGSAYHQNIAAAQRTAQTFQIPGEAIDALEQAVGFDGTMKLLHKIGEGLGEARFVSGESSKGFGDTILTPDAAKAKISELKGDPEFVKKYTSNDPTAKKKMSDLHRMAYPGT